MNKQMIQRPFWALMAWCTTFVTAPDFMAKMAGLDLSTETTAIISSLVGLIALFMQDANGNGTPDFLERPTPDISGPDA
jgi:hypothetical protein